MPCTYISSNQNRVYAALEPAYGSVPAITGRNRVPVVKLTARQEVEHPARRDKTGTRTFGGRPAGLRRRTNYELRVYLSGWTDQGNSPCGGAFFEAGLGAGALRCEGGLIGAGSTARVLRFDGAHGLRPGQAVSIGGELRFVAAVPDAETVELNAPLASAPAAGTPAGKTVTYGPDTSLGSLSIFDFWDPAPAVQRLITGAAVDRLRVRVNGDYHEFTFSGPARELLDSSSFESGVCELTAFPAEPEDEGADFSAIPGHLGQVWIGSAPDRFQTLTAAELSVENAVDLRSNEFGSRFPECISPGRRSVRLDFEIYEQDNSACHELYQAARMESPLPVMLQLGEQPGQLFGVYLKSVVPEVPEYDDSDARLRWRFTDCRAQGTADDEIYVAFG